MQIRLVLVKVLVSELLKIELSVKEAIAAEGNYWYLLTLLSSVTDKS